MSLIHVFDRKKWYRRLMMILMGLGLGIAYFFNPELSPYGPFIATGYMIGFLSNRYLMSVVNMLIVLFAMIASVLVFYLSGALGLGIPVEYEGLSVLTAGLFITKATLAWLMFPGMIVGFLVRIWVLRRSSGAGF